MGYKKYKWFGDLLFGGERLEPWRYINGGFQILNKNHKPFFTEMKNYYSKNKQKIQNSIEKLKTIQDQTILNFMLNKNNVDVKILY